MRKYSKFSILILLLPCLTSCHKVIKEETVITKQEVENAIQEKLPLGSSISDVNTFLDSLKVSPRIIKRENYRVGVPVGDGYPDKPVPELHGYISASIPDARVVRHLAYSDRYWIMLNFYFDEKERMIGHKTYVIGTD